MADARSISVRLSADVTGYIANMRRAGAATESAMGKASRAASVHGKVFGATAAVVKGGGIAIAGGLALAVKEAADFNEKMALVRTLSHANAAEMRALSDAAKNAGTGYGYTASEVADAEAEMIKAGVSLRNIMGGGLKGTLALAAAGQLDVGSATTIAAAAMTQFNLKGRDIPHVADLLAAGADKALGSVQDLGYGLEQSGTTAHQMGLSIEDTVGTLAAFAQAGLIGERGGTTLKQMMLQLAAPTKGAFQLMDHYHLSLYKTNGQLKSMPEIAGNVKRAFQDLTPAERNAALGTIFGSRAIQGANILMQNGRQGIQQWINKVNDQGFAAEQAGGKLNSLKGDLQKFKAAAETAFIDLGQGSQNPLRGFVQDTTSELRKLERNGTLARWGGEIGDTLHTVVADAKKYGPEIGHALQVVGGGIKHVVDGFNGLPKGVQQALVTGGVVAYGAHKLGVDSLAKSTLKSLVSAGGKALGGSKVGMMNVEAAVVNVNGAGSGPGGKDPVGTVAKEGGVAAAVARVLGGARMLGAASPEGLVAYGSTLADWLGNRTVQQRSGHALQNLSATMFPNAPSGQPLAQGKWYNPYATRWASDDKAYLDKALAQKVSSNPTQALQMLAKAAKDANVPITALIANLPMTARGIARLDQGAAGASDAFDSAGMSVKELHALLATLPKAVRTQVETPGAVKSFGDVKRLAAQYHLTPKQIVTLVKASGVPLTSSQVLGLQRFYGLTPREVQTVLRAIDQASGAIGSVRGELAGLNGMVATTTIRTNHYDFYSSGAAAGPPNRTPGKKSAAGSTVPRDGLPYGDRYPYLLAPGEEVISNRHGQADRHRPLLKAINAGRLADGGTAVHNLTVTRRDTTPSSGGGFPRRVQLVLDGRVFDTVVRDIAGDEYASRDTYRHTTGRR